MFGICLIIILILFLKTRRQLKQCPGLRNSKWINLKNNIILESKIIGNKYLEEISYFGLSLYSLILA